MRLLLLHINKMEARFEKEYIGKAYTMVGTTLEILQGQYGSTTFGSLL